MIHNLNEKTIRIGVFGTPGSGKENAMTTASELLSSKGANCQSVSSIDLTREELSMSDHDTLYRNRFTFVDEYYCFPENNIEGTDIDFVEVMPSDLTYRIIFENKWISRYDLAVYMETDPELILDNIQSSATGPTTCTTPLDILLWQQFEVDNIQQICDSANIPLFYIYDQNNAGTKLDMIVSHRLKQLYPDN